MNLGIIGRTYRQVQRYRQILVVLSKYGFDNLVDSLLIVEQRLEFSFAKYFRRRLEPVSTLSRSERARLVIEELGPTFIKLGQILSTRRDLFPRDFIDEFVKLQDKAPSFPFSQVQQIIESEFRMPLGEVYQYFDKTPLAAASFGQVHRARLLGGQEVVVKVQRPNIKEVVEVDLAIMNHVALLMESQLNGWSTHRPTLVVEEFSRLIEQELDYTTESGHLERFSWQFAGEPTIYVPKVYQDAVTQRVLTMEYINGIKASNVEALEQAGLDRNLLAQRGFKLLLRQIFLNGFFHADPHPGNVLILPDNVICYIDFGMMGRIDIRSRENCADLILSVIRRDEVKTTSALLKLTQSERPVDRNLLEKEVGTFMDRHSYRPLKQVELGKFLHQLLDITTRHNLRITPDLFLMMKSLTTAEGIGRTLDPNFDPISQARPFVWQIYVNRFNPRRIISDAVDASTEFAALMGEIPLNLDDILKQIKRGDVKVNLTMSGVEKLVTVADRVSNRLAFAIVLAALLIGSSLVISADITYQFSNIFAIGTIGFIVAAVMGVGLMISILRRGLV